MEHNIEYEKILIEQRNEALYRLSNNFNIFTISQIDQVKEFLETVVFQKNIEKIKVTSNQSYTILYDIFCKLVDNFHTVTILIEENYIDKIYRDTFYFHFSGKYFDYERNCRRLLIFETDLNDKQIFKSYTDKKLNEIFLGSIVIRPVLGREIGRTLIDPEKLVSPGQEMGFVRLSNYHINAFGKSLDVKAFPFSMQDSETMSCAEVTILNLIDYYSNTYPEYYSILPSRIIEIASEHDCERRIPSTGLTYKQMSTILTEVGFYPRLYRADKLKQRKFKRTLHYYIESGIPVGIGLTNEFKDFHSIIGIGHGKINRSREALVENITAISSDEDSSDFLWVSDVADLVEEYCVIDDNKQPYSLYKIFDEIKDDNSICKIDDYQAYYLMVPLYKRMYLEASDAYDICNGILADKAYGIKKSVEFNKQIDRSFLDDDIGGKDNPIVLRLFMASSRTFRNYRVNQFKKIKDRSLNFIYSLITLPKFVWVCEIYTADSYLDGNAMGEIVLDATAAPMLQAQSSIIIHYPGQIFFNNPDGVYNNTIDDNTIVLDDWVPFKQFMRNLIDIKNT